MSQYKSMALESALWTRSGAEWYQYLSKLALKSIKTKTLPYKLFRQNTCHGVLRYESKNDVRTSVVRRKFKLVSTKISKAPKLCSRYIRQSFQSWFGDSRIRVTFRSSDCSSFAKPNRLQRRNLRPTVYLAEKLTILRAKPDMTLNKSSELVAKCRHCNKCKLIKNSFPIKILLRFDLLITSRAVMQSLFFFQFLAIFCPVIG